MRHVIQMHSLYFTECCALYINTDVLLLALGDKSKTVEVDRIIDSFRDFIFIFQVHMRTMAAGWTLRIFTLFIVIIH